MESQYKFGIANKVSHGCKISSGTFVSAFADRSKVHARNRKLTKSYLVLGTIVFISCFFGCKKAVEIIPPVTSTTGVAVYSSDATAIAALTGIYAKMSQTSGSANSVSGFANISLFASLSADELTFDNGIIASPPAPFFFYENSLATNTSGFEFWPITYEYIFSCNDAIEGLTKSTTLTAGVKRQLMGEAKFMRAFFYFYLVNLYGDVPLAVSTDYKVNARLSRSSKTQVFQQIVTDLKEAQSLLAADYVAGDVISKTMERVRPNKWAATALLARAYLYAGDYANAETQATIVIDNSSLYSLTSLNETFLRNSNEAIWQLQPVNAGWNTEDARIFIIPATGLSVGENPVQLSDALLNSFEVGDNRLANWVGSITINGEQYFYPFKYKVNTLNAGVTEYLMVLRLAEQYLIRAEASALNSSSTRGLAGAIADLNTIRNRAGLSNTTASTQATLVAAIQHERQVELFTEWGHRWLDLKRTGSVDAVMGAVTPQKGGTWNTTQQLYPIPISEIQTDLNIVQNPGY